MKNYTCGFQMNLLMQYGGMVGYNVLPGAGQ